MKENVSHTSTGRSVPYAFVIAVDWDGSAVLVSTCAFCGIVLSGMLCGSCCGGV